MAIGPAEQFQGWLSSIHGWVAAWGGVEGRQEASSEGRQIEETKRRVDEYG